MEMTPPSGQDQADHPIKIQHPEEEEHQESGASKMFKKVKAKAKKIKNSLTKHGNEQDQDVDEEDDENDEQEPQVHDPPVYESSAVRGGVTGQPESLSHAAETNVPASEEISPPGTKVFPVVSSDYSTPVEPEPLREASYGHEAPSYPVRSTDGSDWEETREAPSHPVRVSDMSDREESREAHHVPMDTPVSLLSEAEDVTRTFAPDEDEDDNLGGQREVNIETPKRSEEDLSGVSNYQSNVSDLTQQGGGKAGVPEIAESLGKMKVTDGSSDQEPGLGFERDLSTRSHEFEREIESGIGKDSPARLGGESEAELEKDVPTRSLFDQTTESGIDKNSPTGFGSESGADMGEEIPGRSHEYDQKIESGTGEDSPTGFGGKSGTGMREEFLAKSHEFDQEIESLVGKDSSTGFGSESGTEPREDFPARSHELGLKEESGIGKDSPMGSHGYGEESEAGVEKIFPARSDDVEVETGLGSELPAGTHDQYSPEPTRPKERDDFDSKVDETRDETQESKPITYAEQIGSAPSFVTDKAIAAKTAVASGLGYSGETTGADGQHESPMGGETPGTGQKVVGTVDEKLTPVTETGSPGLAKLPLSGGGSGTEEDEGVTAAEKSRPGEEDKALWGRLKEEREQGEAVAEEEKGGGMVGKIKGAYNYWLGGTTEEAKPKSPDSVEESSQSLGSTVGTKGFSDSGESGLGETGGGSSGAVPVEKGL